MNDLKELLIGFGIPAILIIGSMILLLSGIDGDSQGDPGNGGGVDFQVGHAKGQEVTRSPEGHYLGAWEGCGHGLTQPSSCF